MLLKPVSSPPNPSSARLLTHFETDSPPDEFAETTFAVALLKGQTSHTKELWLQLGEGNGNEVTEHGLGITLTMDNDPLLTDQGTCTSLNTIRDRLRTTAATSQRTEGGAVEDLVVEVVDRQILRVLPAIGIR